MELGLGLVEDLVDSGEDGLGGDGGAGDGVDALGAAGLDDLGGQLLDGLGADALGLGVLADGDLGDLAVLDGHGHGHLAADALALGGVLAVGGGSGHGLGGSGLVGGLSGVGQVGHGGDTHAEAGAQNEGQTSIANVLPAIVLGVSLLLPFSAAQRFMWIVVFAAPIATASYPMADAMGCDGRLAGELVTTSTLASVVTLFLWVLVNNAILL